MRIAFLDPITWDYDPETPLGQPLGGVQSAVSYLSAALVRRGHDVTILNAATADRRVCGVLIRSLAAMRIEDFSGWDAIIVVSGVSLDALNRLWPLTRAGASLLLWTQSDTDTQVSRWLLDRKVLASYERIIPASAWHQSVLAAELGVPDQRMHPLGNALAPPFEALLAAPPNAPRSSHPTLAYTGTPFRGLELLLEAWPEIKRAVPDAILKVYSGLGVYQVAERDDPYRPIYDLCRATDGVDYVGSISQTKLAEALSSAWLFAYPSTYRETFCTSLIEAMAAGCHAVVTDLAALPGTALGHATLVAYGEDRALLASRYAKAAIDRLRWIAEAPAQAAAARAAQRETLAKRMLWRGRAEEWERLLISLKTPAASALQPPPAAPPPPGRVQSVTQNRLLVDARHGRLLIDAQDSLGGMIAKYGEWAELELSRLTSVLKPGDVVIEVGAHVGSMTLGLARAVGPGGAVYAFEPQVGVYCLLAANMALNGLDQVRPVQALVGAQAGWRSAPHTAEGMTNQGAVSFVGRPILPTGGADLIQQIMLDDWFRDLDRLRLLKIDVEGMEPEVLTGATELVRRLRPVIQAECTRPDGFDALNRFADALGYDLYWNGCPGYSSSNFFQDPENLLGAMGDLNVILLPRENGERMILPPAFAFEDGGVIHPGVLGPGVWPRSGAPVLSAAILPFLAERGIGRDGAENDADFGRFHQAAESVRFLRQHRDLIELNSFGFGERAFHAMWLELIRDRAAAIGDARPLDLLEIGVFKGQVISLWTLIGKLLRLPLTIDAIGPLSGEGPTDPAAQAQAYRCGEGNIVPPDDYPRLIADLFARCALDIAAVRFLRGVSQQPDIIATAKPEYDVVYIDGDHAEAAVRADLDNYAHRVRPGGYLVLDDAALFLEGSFWKGFEGPSRAADDVPAYGFRNILNVGHNRVFQRLASAD